jgi:phospholipid-binding lipoprotein MlaA
MKKGFFFTCLSALVFSGCIHRCPNPDDPLEAFNRQVFKMNMAFDATVLKPPAELYLKIFPAPIRAGINNVFDNVAMLPTIANDILQLQKNHTINDMGRLSINSLLGLGGIGDVATQLGVPLHHNDFGLTLAHWGNTKTPYVMIPFLGPCTLRDSMSLLVDYTFFSPYPFIPNAILYRVLGLRYVDLRSQMMDNMNLLKNAIDPYVLMRDAYLQHRQVQIMQNQTGQVDVMQDNSSSLYVEED